MIKEDDLTGRTCLVGEIVIERIIGQSKKELVFFQVRAKKKSVVSSTVSIQRLLLDR